MTSSLAPQAARVVVGGGFTRVDGRRGQTSIAALGPARGLVRPWASHPRSLILDLALCGNRIYAAEGGPGGTALAYGLKGHLKWYYITDGNVQAVTACVGHRPVFGMHGDYVAPHRNQTMSEHGSSKRIQRHKLFMLTRRGVLERWNPDLSSTAGVLGVWSLAAGSGNLYVGGDFTGDPRPSPSSASPSCLTASRSIPRGTTVPACGPPGPPASAPAACCSRRWRSGCSRSPGRRPRRRCGWWPSRRRRSALWMADLARRDLGPRPRR